MNASIIGLAMILLQTTQPASVSEDMARLHRIISQLRAENAALKRENAELKKQLAVAKPAVDGQEKPSSIYQRPRPSDPHGAFKKLTAGMSIDEVCDILGYPGGPGRSGAPIEDTDGNAKYFWDYARDSQTSGTKITAWFKDEKLVRAEKD